MKRLKFRAWSGCTMMFKEFDDRNWYGSEATRAKTITTTSTSDSRKYIIMQKTGLFDINDKPIYEGDIVKVKTGVTSSDVNHWSVDYVDHLAYCGFKFYGKDRRFNIKASRSSIVNNHVEIIGNIHENPELIGG